MRSYRVELIPFNVVRRMSELWSEWFSISSVFVSRRNVSRTFREKKKFWKGMGLSCRENISKMLKWCLVVEWLIWSNEKKIVTTRNFGSLSTSILLSRSASNVRDGNQERYWLPPCQTGMLRIRDYMSPRRYTNRLHGFGSCLLKKRYRSLAAQSGRVDSSTKSNVL